MLSFCFVAFAVMVSPANAAKAVKPNIIWVMADDLGWGEIGLYPAGSEHGRISTPNLDLFGKEGIQFTDAYAGYTVCAPSRTTLFTGRHSGHFIQNNYPGTSLPVGAATTTAMMLKAAGYTTAAVGKVAPLDSPTEQGFDYFIGQVNQGYCHNMYPHFVDTGNSTMNVNLTLNWKNKSRTNCMADPSAFNYTVDITHQHSLAWLDANAEASIVTSDATKEATPFFLYTAFTVPHAGGWGSAPTQPESGAPVPTDVPYVTTGASWPDVERDHAAVITYLDNCMGELLAKVKSLGIDEQTLIFFASDNGAHLEGGHSNLFFNSTGGLLGHKRSLYEGGVRSPTMARWPGTIKPAVSNFAWAFWDVLPTLAELAGGVTPAGLDGISIVPTLMGGDTQKEHDYLYWTWDGTGVLQVPPTDDELYPVASSKGGSSGYGVRVGNWKGVVAHCIDNVTMAPSLQDDLMLYDLATDPFETTNIAPGHPDQVTTMIKLLMTENVKCNCFQC